MDQLGVIAITYLGPRENLRGFLLPSFVVLYSHISTSLENSLVRSIKLFLLRVFWRVLSAFEGEIISCRERERERVNKKK